MEGKILFHWKCLYGRIVNSVLLYYLALNSHHFHDVLDGDTAAIEHYVRRHQSLCNIKGVSEVTLCSISKS